jgi:4-hydroxy-2-oxoheptanedioate aldolase
MNGKNLGSALREGKRVYGTVVVSPSPLWPEAIKALGLDFVFIDTEHIALDRFQVSWMCRVYSNSNLAPLVRIPKVDEKTAAAFLDAGAEGIVAPYVETVEQVKRLVGAVKLRPIQGEQLKRLINETSELKGDLRRYIENNNINNVLIVNIESQEGINNLDEILAVPGLDGVLIGPHDLSCSLGVPEEYKSEIFTTSIENIIKKARENQIGAGIHFFAPDSIEEEIRLAELGSNLILHSADLHAFKQFLQDDFTKIKEALGDSETAEKVKINI